MNLYFRLILIIIDSFFKPKIDFDRELSLNLRVMPNDLDLNSHLNNGRYLTLLDLASIALFLRSGIFKRLFSPASNPLLAGRL